MDCGLYALTKGASVIPVKYAGDPFEVLPTTRVSPCSGTTSPKPIVKRVTKLKYDNSALRSAATEALRGIDPGLSTSMAL